MEQVSDFVFITMANVTLARREVTWFMLNLAIKPETLSPLGQAPLHMAIPFPDSSLKKAEEDIAQYENKGHASSSSHKKDSYHPYDRSDKSSQPAWKTIGSRGHGKKHKGKSSNYSS